jgi:uncharacterized paraquat-inducible protein A
VAVEIFTGAGVFLLTMVSLLMLQAGNLDSRIFGESLTPGEYQTFRVIRR